VFFRPILRIVPAIRRAAAVLAAFALMSLQAGAVCEGWQSTPEARMACCEATERCAMHAPPPQTVGHGHPGHHSQSGADTCCAMSEPGNSGERGATFAPSAAEAALDIAAAVAAGSPATAYARHRSTAPPPRGHVPKHVLLSVFLL
jgi:hypothetical protein